MIMLVNRYVGAQYFVPELIFHIKPIIQHMHDLRLFPYYPYLKPEFLKIDLSIVRDIHENYIKQDIVLALKELSKRTGSILIAEGIEKEAEYNILKDMGVQFGQGFFFSPPEEKPVEKITRSK